MSSDCAKISLVEELQSPNMCFPITLGVGSSKHSQLPVSRLPLPAKPLFNKTTTAFRNIC